MFRALALRQSKNFCSDEGLLETSAIVSLTTSITLINTQLIHQFSISHNYTISLEKVGRMYILK